MTSINELNFIIFMIIPKIISFPLKVFLENVQTVSK